MRAIVITQSVTEHNPVFGINCEVVLSKYLDMGLDYKSLYETLILELEFLKKEREKLKEENDLLGKIRIIQSRPLLDREKKIKETGGKLKDK